MQEFFLAEPDQKTAENLRWFCIIFTIFYELNLSGTRQFFGKNVLSFLFFSNPFTTSFPCPKINTSLSSNCLYSRPVECCDLYGIHVWISFSHMFFVKMPFYVFFCWGGGGGGQKKGILGPNNLQVCSTDVTHFFYL